MSFSANCISCHMCQNICFWIVHFCWEFLSEFPKQWYLLRHLFISVQFMRLGEPTLCVFLQFCTSSLYSYSFVDFLREHHALCIPAMWTSVYLCWHSLKFVHVTRLAERHRWPPSRGWEGLKSVVAISKSSSSSSHCWGEQGNFQIRFFITNTITSASKSAVWPGRDDQRGRQRPTWEIERRTDRPTGRFAKIRETQQFVIVLNLFMMYLCSPTSKVI